MAAMPQPLTIDSTVSSDRSAFRPGRKWPISATAGSEAGFGQGGGIAIVFDLRRQVELLLAPLAQFKIFPAVDLMAFDHAIGRRVDGSAETEADAADAVPLDQGRRGRFDLMQDAVGAIGRIDGET